MGDIGFGGSWMANAWTVRYEMARRCFRDSSSGQPAASHSTGSLHSPHSGSMVSATLPARRLRPCLPINCFHFDRSLVGRPGAPFGSRRSAEDAGRQNARHIHGHCPKIGAWTSFACMLSESLLPTLRHRPVIRVQPAYTKGGDRKVEDERPEAQLGAQARQHRRGSSLGPVR